MAFFVTLKKEKKLLNLILSLSLPSLITQVVLLKTAVKGHAGKHQTEKKPLGTWGGNGG